MKDYDRLRDLTRLSSFAISLVVLEHALIFMNDEKMVPYIFIYLQKLIVSFIMPLFISISGFLFIHTNINWNSINYKDLILKKIKRLILPYFIISSIAFIPKVVLSSYALRPLEFSFKSYLNGIIFPYLNPIMGYWFLPTLFIIFVLFGIIVKNPRVIKNGYFNILLTIVLLFVHLYNPCSKIALFNLKWVVYYLIYFWLGCLLCLYKEKLTFLGRKDFFMFFSLLLLVLNILGINNAYLNLAKALAGILAGYSLFKVYTFNRFKILNFIEGYSYQIYLLSWFFQILVRIVFYQILGLNYYLVFVFILTSGLILPVLVTKLICKYLPSFRIIISVSPHA